jgi:glycosyltransferase involved in cell wall biosynthesis
MKHAVKTIESQKRFRTRPRLSVLIPFYRDNPGDLLEALLNSNRSSKDVEVLIYDDGTNDSDLSAALCAQVREAQSPVRLLIAKDNNGRAFARNYLVAQARADWVLFLDADMLPVTPHFVQDYLTAISSEDTDIVFGGFHVPDHTDDPERELHRAFSQTSDALSVEERNRFGPQYVCSSNLCVRRTVIQAEAFDPEFTGWGWEDSEWAARAGKRFKLTHADIPALHLGLETTDTLLRRFKDSGGNYQRFTQRHPELAKSLNLYKAVQRLKNIPGHQIVRPALKMLVKLNFAPVQLRLAALKLWRASWYADTMS